MSEFKHYRKKPIIIEAARWFQNGDHPEDRVVTSDEKPTQEGKIVRYFRSPDQKGNELCGQCGKYFHDHGWIDTMEGGHIVCPGDFIITGVKGEHYPCKPDIFEQTYEEVK
jgi:hypothetical protein